LFPISQKRLECRKQNNIKEYSKYVFYKRYSKMKKKLIWLSLSVFLILGLSVLAQYQQQLWQPKYSSQWFVKFQEGLWWTIDFECTNQCVALLGPLSPSDYLQIKGTIQWNWNIGYWFLVWQQIYPWDGTPINWWWDIDHQFSFSKVSFLSQIPSDSQVALLVQWNIIWSQISLQMWSLGLFEKFRNWFNQALEYKSYNPRTINFLEWPMRNGKYINQAFLWRIIWFLALAVLIYSFSTEKKNRQKAVYFGIWVIAFFWIFFDFFSTVNEVKIYKDATDATNIMENGRVGKDSDFYQFLDFIKTKVPKGEKWFFLAPYPYYFEWKYHVYPNVKFDKIDNVKYIFYYNPYGANTPFEFKDPIYTSGVLNVSTGKYLVDEEIVRKPYAKIYRLLPK